MTRQGIEAIVEAHRVRYLIAGGLAVVAHGYVRFTADVDVLVDLEPDNVRAGDWRAGGSRLSAPRAPVPFQDFAEAGKREQWIAEQGLTVFSLHSAARPATEIDLCVQPPLDFGAASRAAVQIEIAPGLRAVFVSYDDLLRLKSQAGRPQDLEDIRQLEALRREPSGE